MKTSIRTLRIFLFLVFCFIAAPLLQAQNNDNTQYPAVNTADDAVIMGMNVPADMDKEHVYTVSYTVKNTGSSTWKAGDYKLKISVMAADATDNSRWLIP